MKIDGEFLSNLRFADDTFLCTETPQELQYMLQELPDESRRMGLKMNIAKRKVIVVDNTPINVNNVLIEADCKNRVRLSWNKRRETTGVICDKKVPVKQKVKIYQTVIKPTMLYGAECWAMRKKEEHLLNKTEMRMLRWIQGISLKDHVRSEEIRKRLNVMPIVDQVTKRRLSWYGHIKRRKPEDMTRDKNCA